MKKIWLKIILPSLFIAGTIITLFIVYKDIDTSFSFKFVIGYVIFLLLYSLFLTYLVISNLMKLQWVEIRKRLSKFIFRFILLSASLYLFNYLFRPSEIDIFDFGIPLGLSIALSFSDLMFIGKKEN